MYAISKNISTAKHQPSEFHTKRVSGLVHGNDAYITDALDKGEVEKNNHLIHRILPDEINVQM